MPASVDEELGKLYNDIMSGLDFDNAPDLGFTAVPSAPVASSAPRSLSRPSAERKATNESDKLMDIYNSYTESEASLSRTQSAASLGRPELPSSSPSYSLDDYASAPQSLPSVQLEPPSVPTVKTSPGRVLRPLPRPPSDTSTSPTSSITPTSPHSLPFRPGSSSGVIRRSRQLPIAPNAYRTNSLDPSPSDSSGGWSTGSGSRSSTAAQNPSSSYLSTSGNESSYFSPLDGQRSDATTSSINDLAWSGSDPSKIPESGARVTAQRAVSHGKKSEPRTRWGVVPPPRTSSFGAPGNGLSGSGDFSTEIPSSSSNGGEDVSALYQETTHRNGAARQPPPLQNPVSDLSRDTSLSASTISSVAPSSSEDAHYASLSSSSTANTSVTSHTIHPSDSGASSSPTEWQDNDMKESRTRLELHEETDYDFVDDFPDPDDIEEDYLNTSLLSHVAVKLRDKIVRGTHVKGSIPYPNAFTGKDVVSTVQSIIQRDLPDIIHDRRRTALLISRSLQNQLFFYEVEWGDRLLSDGVEDVFTFLDDMEGDSSAGQRPDRAELPTAVITPITKCYSPTCDENDKPCYSYSCPRRLQSHLGRSVSDRAVVPEPVEERGWADGIDAEVLKSLPVSEINRQTVIARIISQEAQYVNDLDLIDSLFVKPLRMAREPIIEPDQLDSFIDVVFGNILDLRETNRRLLEVMYVRQREQGPIIQWIGDIFLTAAVEFRVVYPLYVGNLPLAEKRVKDETENNSKFRTFLEQQARSPESRRLDLRHFITRPSEHLQRYPTLLEAIRNETADGNPDAEYLREASEAIRKLSTAAQLRTFQTSMGRGSFANQQWHDLVPVQIRDLMARKEIKRQSAIFELIKGEMEYVRDLELIPTLFIRPLKECDLPLPDNSERGLEDFLREIFYNYHELLGHHRRLMEALHEIQREEYPSIRSIIAPIYDAALNWQDAYVEYVSHYPIARYRVEEAMAMPQFRRVVEEAQRHPDAGRLDIKFFINRPIPRMLRYDLLLKAVLAETPEGHEDLQTIPEVSEVIRSLSKSLDHSIASAERKVEMWRYNRNLVWKPGEEVDMDLLDETRTLIHTGRLLRQPEGSMEWSGWTELFVLLFDNYLVMTKPKEKDGVTKYHVNRRPIPLDLLTFHEFEVSPQQRSTSLLGGLRGGGRNQHPEAMSAGERADANDSRLVYPCSIHHLGRVGGMYQLFAESAQSRAEWQQKLTEALGLRAAVQEGNKVFEQTTISMDTFVVPGLQTSSVQTYDGTITGRVTCSVPITAADGRGLVAVGCAEGVWIGLRHDSRSMRRVLHLKQVTQCAMLEEFGIFLVLADKSLFAYHIEALVPTGPPGSTPQRQPQKLNGSRDVQFFSVGSLNGRTLIIYMKKKGLDSVFRVLEPVTDKIAEKAKAPTFSRNFFGPKQSEWFRVYKEFFLPSESFDLIFLKLRIAILCTKGFEIMDLTDFKSDTIPHSDDPRHGSLLKRCESCKPMGMFRSGDNEFLLCYDEFGLYVDRHGYPNRPSGGVIEWEGTAERVAFHAPHILIFDSRFIEVRHISKGKLVQIIPGTDVHCTWDGRGGGNIALPNVVTTPGWEDRGGTGETRLHAVMTVEGSSGPRAVPQHVFELNPTQLLYAPPSLQSPAPFFPSRRSNSPPRSPRPSSTGSGWTR